MPSYDYVCPEGHVFDGVYRFEEKVVPCRGCLGEPGIADGFSDVQLRMAKAFVMAMIARMADMSGQAYANVPEARNFPPAHRCLLAMPSWMRRQANPLKIVVHRDPRTGQYRFPGHADAPVPPGFNAIEIDSVAKARKVERDIRRQEEARAADVAYRRLAQKDSKLAQHEADLKAALRGEAYEVPDKQGKMVRVKGLTDHGKELVGEAITMVQQARKEGPKIITQAGDVGFEVLSYDRSNRDGYRSERTNWKEVRE